MMLIGMIAAVAMAANTPAASADPDFAMIGQATDALLDATPNLASAEFRNVRVVRLPAHHEAVCGEVGGDATFHRFAYDTVTKVAQTESGNAFTALWANCGG